MIDITGLVKANSSSPASVSKPEIKDKDTRKVWDMTLEEIGYYLTLCDTDEKVMRFMSLLSPEQMKMIAEQGEKASEELAAEYFDTGTGDDEEFVDPDEEPEPSEEELEEEAEDFFGSDDEDDFDEAEDTASDEPDAGSVEEEPDDEALFADSDEPDAGSVEEEPDDEALFADSDDEEPINEELSGDTSVDEVSDEALFTDTDENEGFSDEDEELSDEDEELSDEKNIGSELSNPQPIAEAVQEESIAGTATQVIEPSEDISFFEGTDDDDSEDESFFSDDDEEYEEVFDDDSDVSEEPDEFFNDDSDEDEEFEAAQTSVVPEPVKIQPSVVPEPVKIQPSVVPEPVKIQPSVIPEPVKIQPSVVTSTVQRTLVPKKKLTRGTTQEHTPVKIPQIPVDKAENPVRNPVGTSTRGYDVSNKKNLCGEKYQDGWSLIKYLQANRGNKKACSKEVVLHYYSLETIERGEDMGKFVISKGILRF